MFSLHAALTFGIAVAVGLVRARSDKSSNDQLRVTTETGTYVGIINGTTPHVRQFLNIPYAIPPVGERRWLPPAQVTSNSSTIFDATRYPRSCSQYISKINFAGPEFLPQVLNAYGSQNTTAGLYAETTGEDCLSLAVWTPTGNVARLPVILWMPGGGFVWGRIEVPMQIPSHWVERTQTHIVVSIK
ncbi:carboxylic ester hydrolase [Lipomyces starkeyi]